MSRLYVQLDAETLARVLTGQPVPEENHEIYLEIRQWVVQEFVRRHLKGLIDQTVINSIESSIPKIVAESVSRQFGELIKIQFGTKFELTPMFKAKVDEQVASFVEREVENRIKAYVEQNITDEVIDRAVKMAVTSYLKNELSQRLKAAMETALETALAGIAVPSFTPDPAAARQRRVITNPGEEEPEPNTK